MTDDLLETLDALSNTDLDLVACVLADTYRLTDEDSGDDVEARRKAYMALSKFVRSRIRVTEPA